MPGNDSLLKPEESPGLEAADSVPAEMENMPIEAVQKLQADNNAQQEGGAPNVGKSIGDSHSDMYQMNPADVDALNRSGVDESRGIVVGVTGQGGQQLDIQGFDPAHAQQFYEQMGVNEGMDPMDVQGVPMEE